VLHVFDKKKLQISDRIYMSTFLQHHNLLVALL